MVPTLFFFGIHYVSQQGTVHMQAAYGVDSLGSNPSLVFVVIFAFSNTGVHVFIRLIGRLAGFVCPASFLGLFVRVVEWGLIRLGYFVLLYVAGCFLRRWEWDVEVNG